LDAVPSEWAEQFVSKSTDLYLTEEKIQMIEDLCVNSQDAVIIRLIFEGVFGSACSELLNLKVNDVNFESNILHLTDEDGAKRVLLVSERCISLIQRAIEQKRYIKRTGNRNSKYTDLIITERVIRMSKTRSNESGLPDKFLIYRRITNLSKLFDIPNLSPKMIQQSGMLYELKRLHDKFGALEEKHYDLIKNRFNIKKSTFNTMKSVFLNMDTVEKVYGI
jgi:integrase